MDPLFGQPAREAHTRGIIADKGIFMCSRGDFNSNLTEQLR